MSFKCSVDYEATGRKICLTTILPLAQDHQSRSEVLTGLSLQAIGEFVEALLEVYLSRLERGPFEARTEIGSIRSSADRAHRFA
jgi:hypothetical protein